MKDGHSPNTDSLVLTCFCGTLLNQYECSKMAEEGTITNRAGNKMVKMGTVHKFFIFFFFYNRKYLTLSIPDTAHTSSSISSLVLGPYKKL